MNLSDLLCCIQCGSQPLEVDYTGCMEYYGITEQSAYIKCSGKNKEHCPIDVTISFDSDGKLRGEKIERALKAAWNELNAT